MEHNSEHPGSGAGADSDWPIRKRKKNWTSIVCKNEVWLDWCTIEVNIFCLWNNFIFQITFQLRLLI